MQWPRTLVGMDAHSRKLALCVSRWEYGSDPRRVKRAPYVALENLERFYLSNVPRGSTTIIEATTNAVVVKSRLEAIGYAVDIVRSDALKSLTDDDRVTDMIDAEKLTVAYARGANLRLVRAPDPASVGYRALFLGSRTATRDSTRSSNRIWGLCSEYGLPLPGKRGAAKVEEVRRLCSTAKLNDLQVYRLEDALSCYERMRERKKAFEDKIAGITLTCEPMRRLMQLYGVKHILAFALVAFIGDVDMFETPKKLVSYFGLNPRVNASGETEEANRRKGRNGKTSRFGRQDVKSLLVEAAQSVLKNQKRSSELGRWGARLLARGVDYNKVVTAIARKLVTYAWHILKGHPTPNREGEEFFTRKVRRIYREIGKKRMAEIGFPDTASLVKEMVEKLFAHLPPPAANGSPSGRSTKMASCQN